MTQMPNYKFQKLDVPYNWVKENNSDEVTYLCFVLRTVLTAKTFNRFQFLPQHDKDLILEAIVRSVEINSMPQSNITRMIAKLGAYSNLHTLTQNTIKLISMDPNMKAKLTLLGIKHEV